MLTYVGHHFIFFRMYFYIDNFLKGYLWYRKRPASFVVLHVDNPVYRRTVEEIDADMDPFSDGEKLEKNFFKSLFYLTAAIHAIEIVKRGGNK